MSEELKKTDNKTEEKKGLNILVIVVPVIFIYLVISFCTYFFNNTTRLYEVTEGSGGGRFNSQYNALIIRSESVVNAEKDGYVNFLTGDSTPVNVGAQTCVIDSSGTFNSMLEEAAINHNALTESDMAVVKSSIYDFDTSFDPDNFYDAYNFKYRIDSQITDLINSNLFSDNLSVFSAGSGYSVVKSEIAGIMLHNVDGFEKVNTDNVEASMFRKANYNKCIIKNNEHVESGSPIYKIVTDDDWQLVIQLSDTDDYSDVEYVTVEFLKDGIITDAYFDTFTRAGVKYGVITLNKYMIRYISDRYEQIQILSDSVQGLKIPKTAVGEKQFYSIPVDFLTQGGDSSVFGFMAIKDDSVEFINPLIYKQNDEFCYVSTEDIEEGTLLLKTGSNTQFKVSARENLDGAYLSGGGGFSFRIIDILGEQNSYYIVASNTPNGLKVYDQIRMNAPDD